MPTKNPRLNIVLEPDTFRNIKGIAAKEKVSMSLFQSEILKTKTKIQSKNVPY